MMSHVKMAVLSVAALALAPGVVSAQTFNMTGNMVDNGTYGNALTFNTTTPSTLQMRVTGWQSNQSNNAITTAYIGSYSPGLGVTGINDQNGANGYHQIDNSTGYTDFILLQFNAPVVLSSLYLNSFTLGNATTKDNDMAIYAANIPTAAWNSAIDLTQYTTSPSLWTTVAGNGSDGNVPTGITMASRQWLVGAAFNSGNNDGFKIQSITVAVPEPAAWAMMIIGFGAVGCSLRVRRAKASTDASGGMAEAA